MISFVQPDWVQEHLDEEALLVIDPRRRMRYLSGHLPRAINVPMPQAFDSEGRLLPVERLTEWLGSRGVSRDRTVLVYDSYDGQMASTLAWILEFLGHRDVRFMTVTFESWKEQRRDVSYRETGVESSLFDPRIRLDVRSGIEEIDRGSGTLLDARSSDEFSGQDSSLPRPGHIPGARNVPWTEFVCTDGELFRPANELRSLLKRSGIDPQNSLIAYCRTGPRAAVVYVALQRLGSNASVYDRSYLEWSRRLDLPVES